VGDTTAGLHILVARKILPSLPGMKDKLEAGARVLDVGCGLGGLMCKVAEAWPNAECVGLDIDPHGIELAEARIADAGLADRVSVRLASGEAAADEEFDLALMFEVLHEIDAGVRAGVVEGAARSLKPGGVLWILDETYPASLAELRDPSFNFAVQTQLNELVWGNVVPTEAEQQSLLSGAGLSLVHREMIGGIFTMLVAVKD
jgi:cyclopropane fatty-acyl-phospholipid synthase-like methyltransferase